MKEYYADRDEGGDWESIHVPDGTELHPYRDAEGKKSTMILREGEVAHQYVRNCPAARADAVGIDTTRVMSLGEALETYPWFASQLLGRSRASNRTA